MDIYASAGIEEPATSIDACTSDGFHLNNGVETVGGRGLMLVGGEGFVWAPWKTTSSAGDTKKSPFSAFIDDRGLLSIPSETLGILSLLHPRPDLLIFGTGHRLHMLHPATRKYISEECGIRVDVMDTANAAASYNLLVMERGVEGVGAILLPVGFTGR
jgi:NADH dehydrogenase [ubiquinone] 1 alpha subcomplex assembly factor 3